MNTYHIFDKEEQKGPFTARQIGSMWDQGLLTASAQYFDDERQEWKLVSELISSQSVDVPPSPLAPPPTPAAPTFHSHVIVPAQTEVVMRQPYKNLFTASWIILLLICCGSMVPFLGWIMWFIAIPLLLVTFVLSIVILSRGGTAKGIAILACTLVVTPVFMVCAQLLVSGVTAVAGLSGIAALLNSADGEGKMTKSVAQGKQLGLALKLWAGDHDGKYPAQLDQVFPTYINSRSLFICPLDPKNPIGYDYFSDLTDASAPDSVLLRSKAKTSDGRRIFVYLDNRAEAKLDDGAKTPKVAALQDNSEEEARTARAKDHTAPTLGRFNASAGPSNVTSASDIPLATSTSRLDSPTPSAPVTADATPGGVNAITADVATPEPTPRRLPEKSWDRPHVYIQICDETQRSVAGLLRKQLQANGDVVADVDNVHNHPSVPEEASEVRYIVADDANEAKEIAGVVRQFTSGSPVSTAPPVPETPYVSHSRQYEIWLAKSFQPPASVSRLDPAKVNTWNTVQIQTAIDEIYARRGANFPRKKDQEWANRQSWYHAVPGLTHDAAEQLFTVEERADVELLAARRAALAKGEKPDSVVTPTPPPTVAESAAPTPNLALPEISPERVVTEVWNANPQITVENFRSRYADKVIRFTGTVVRKNAKEELLVFRGGGFMTSAYDVQATIKEDQKIGFRDVAVGDRLNLVATMDRIVPPALGVGSCSIRLHDAQIYKKSH